MFFFPRNSHLKAQCMSAHKRLYCSNLHCSFSNLFFFFFFLAITVILMYPINIMISESLKEMPQRSKHKKYQANRLSDLTLICPLVMAGEIFNPILILKCYKGQHANCWSIALAYLRKQKNICSFLILSSEMQFQHLFKGLKMMFQNFLDYFILSRMLTMLGFAYTLCFSAFSFYRWDNSTH